MQWRTVQIVADINTIVYVFIRSWRQDPSVGSFKQHGKCIALSNLFFEYLLSSSNPRLQPWKTRCFNEQVIAIFVPKNYALCYLCLFWRKWNAYCRASGSSTHFSSALVRLVSHNIGAISTRIETKEEKYTMKLGQLKINCLPLLWDHIGSPWRPGQPHQPRWAGPFRQQTDPGRT